jgi:predicted flavoprotein YhiN
MNMSDDFIEMTLDPPGTIVVVGGGPVGVEAALYGRFLGYNVTLLEREAVGSSLAARGDQPLDILPDRCLSTLARGALEAQIGPRRETLPSDCQAWVQQTLVPLSESDLLAGRVQTSAHVRRIVRIPIEPDDADSADELAEIPEDFRLQLESGETIDAEAVIVAIGGAEPIGLDFPTPAPYFFELGRHDSGDPEADLKRAWREIVDVYAALAGRADLDLYRPRRN